MALCEASFPSKAFTMRFLSLGSVKSESASVSNRQSRKRGRRFRLEQRASEDSGSGSGSSAGRATTAAHRIDLGLVLDAALVGEPLFGEDDRVGSITRRRSGASHGQTPGILQGGSRAGSNGPD